MVSPVKPEVIPMILEAAQKQFARYGFKKTTMNEIADEIGMSKASLYYYFPNKEELFKEVIRGELAEFIKKFDNIVSSGSDYQELLISYAEMRHVYFQKFINLGKLSSEVMKSVKPLYSELFTDFTSQEVTLVGKILDKGVQSGDLHKKDMDAHVKLFVSIIQALRKNILMSRNIEDFTDEDYEDIKHQSMTTAYIFGKGIKTKL